MLDHDHHMHRRKHSPQVAGYPSNTIQQITSVDAKSVGTHERMNTMSNSLNETIGTMDYDNLIADATPALDAFTITIRGETSTATLKRGTLLDLSTGAAGDGKYVIHGTTAKDGENLTANCILAANVELDTGDTTATAYRAGHFTTGSLVMTVGATITRADREALRHVGILLSDAFA